MRSDVISLVAENPAAHGIFDKPSEVERKVMCRVRSVSSADYWRAYSNGVYPSLVFVLADAAEYNGEKIVIYKGKRLAVVRTYTDGKGIEITVEEATADA